MIILDLAECTSRLLLVENRRCERRFQKTSVLTTVWIDVHTQDFPSLVFSPPIPTRRHARAIYVASVATFIVDLVCDTGPLPGELLIDPVRSHTYRVFISSGADANVMRDRVDRVFETASRVLANRVWPLRIDVVRWEDFAAQRTRGPMNDLFVDKAKECHLVIALLLNDIRRGTFEELDAVLRLTDRQVALLWLHEPGEPVTPKLERFTKKWGGRLVYDECGPPTGERSWTALVKVLVDFILHMIESEQGLTGEPMYEDR